MLGLDSWPAALANWSAMLASGSALIQRIYSWRLDAVPGNGSTGDARLRKTLADGRRRGLGVFQAAAYEVYRRVVDTGTWVMDMRLWIAEVRRLHRRGLLSSAELASLAFLQPSLEAGFSMAIPPREAIERRLTAAGLRVTAIVDGGRSLPLHADYPIYVAEPSAP